MRSSEAGLPSAVHSFGCLFSVPSEAIGAGQHDVQRYQSRLLTRNRFERPLGVCFRVHLVPVGCQNP